MAIGAFDDLGTCSYRGLSFNETFASRVSGRMVYDEAGRAVKAVEFTLKISGYLAGTGVGITTDDDVEEMINTLSQPGGELLFSSKGFGPLNVNDGQTFDCDWGPKPKVVSWRPAGRDKAAFVEWECTTMIPRCDNAKFKGLAAWNYEVSDAIDEAGYTTRTVSGYAEIAQTRPANGGRAVAKTADSLREDIAPPVPLGFRIQSQNWRTNKSKNRLDYSVVFKEVPYPLPKGIPVAEVDDTIEGGMATGFVNWNRTVSGYVRLSPGYNKKLAFRKILLIILSCLRTQALPDPDGKPPNIPLGKEHTTILWNLRVTNSKFGDRVSFSALIRLIGPTLLDVLNGSGIFDPVPDTDFTRWKTSLTAEKIKPWGPRGVADLEVDADADVVLDLCSNLKPLRLTPKATARPGGPLPLNGGKNDDAPDVVGSWIDFQCSAKVKINWLASVQKTLQNVGKKIIFGPSLTDLAALAKAVGDAVNIGPAGAVQNILQRVGNPTIEVHVRGRALRIGQKILAPQLESIGDIKVGEGADEARLVEEQVDDGIRGTIGGLPIFAIMWKQRYVLPRQPAKREATANPMLKFQPEKPKP